MNILYLFYNPITPYRGGIERVTSLLGAELVRRGHKVSYLCTRASEASLGDPGQYNNPQYGISGFESDADHYLNSYLRLLADLNIDIVINQHDSSESHFLMSHTPESILRLSCCHMQPFAYIGRERMVKRLSYPDSLLKKFIRWASIICPLPFHLHSLKLGRREMLNMAQTSDRVILLSDKFKQRVLDNCPGFPPDKLHAINNPNTFSAAPSYSMTEKEQFVLYVGRLSAPQKNIKGFIKMWVSFSKRHPDWKAAIVGDGPQREMYEEYARKLGATKLTFEGRQTDVVSYYRRARFVCLTSLYEGWGMVLTEGMAYGCIPVCFDSYEACTDIINDGVTGIIAHDLDPSDMASRMDEVVRNPEKLKSITLAANQAYRRFDVKNIVDQWEALFEEIQ